MSALFLVAGHQLLAWALGMVITVAFLDLGSGFTRDHPPLGWRLVGMLSAPIALLGFTCITLGGPIPYAPALTAPFPLTVVLYAFSWYRRERWDRRRARGRDSAIVGVGTMLLLMLSAGPEQWSGGIVIAAYTASAALLGGLCTILITVLTAHAASDEISVPATPYGIPARVTAGGLLITLMAALEMLINLHGSMPDVTRAVGIWMALSLGLPLALVAVGHGLFPRFQRPVWLTAFCSALTGQAAILFVVLLHPGLVPPTL